MISSMSGLPRGITGLSVRGTVLAQDVDQALRMVTPAGRLAVSVEPEFDGYMAELVRGVTSACAGGTLAACALIVPEGMLAEAREQGEGPRMRIFASGARDAALAWLAGA